MVVVMMVMDHDGSWMMMKDGQWMTKEPIIFY